MPVKQYERKKVSTHTFSEDKRSETDTVYHVPPQISAGTALSTGFSKLGERLHCTAFYLPEGLAFALFLLLLFGAHSPKLALLYTAGFMIFQFFVSSILDAEAASGFIGARFSRPVSAIALSFSYFRPLAYAIFVWMLLFAFGISLG